MAVRRWHQITTICIWSKRNCSCGSAFWMKTGRLAVSAITIISGQRLSQYWNDWTLCSGGWIGGRSVCVMGDWCPLTSLSIDADRCRQMLYLSAAQHHHYFVAHNSTIVQPSMFYARTGHIAPDRLHSTVSQSSSVCALDLVRCRLLAPENNFKL